MKSGDTVTVHVQGARRRQGARAGVRGHRHRHAPRRPRASFTVRKVSFGQGVERIFPLHSPTIQKVDVVRSAKVRRAKLYFLRDLKGKAARMKETEARRRTVGPGAGASRRYTLPGGRSWCGRVARRTIENALRRLGFLRVAGVDEVGRGCLAGPVVAGAVVLDPGRHIAGLCRLEARARRRSARPLYDDDRAPRASAWAVASVEPDEIDRINIHQASLQAMRRAVLALAPLPDVVLVDAFRIPDLPMAQRGVVQGDRAMRRDRGRVDRRQGDARSHDAGAARRRSALRLRPSQGLRDARAPRRRRTLWLLGGTPPLVPAAVAV